MKITELSKFKTLVKLIHAKMEEHVRKRTDGAFVDQDVLEDIVRAVHAKLDSTQSAHVSTLAI